MSDQSNSASSVWFGVGLAAAAAGVAVQRYRAFMAREIWRQSKAAQGVAWR